MRYALVTALFTALFVGGCGSTPSEQATPEDDFSEPKVDQDLPPTFDDGLGKQLDEDPIDPAPIAPDKDAGVKDAGDDAATPAKTPTCDATAKTGQYCGGDKVSNASKNTLYQCDGPGKATVVKVCATGCVVAPAGSDDYCKPAEGACPSNPTVLKYGLHPIASDRLRCAGITAARIMQTIGSAAASAGTHAQDGVSDGHPYTAATDLSVSGLTDAQAKTLIAKLDTLGFAAYFRKPGYDGWPSTEIRHVHVVFAGAKMKSSLRAQISDFLAGKNGLASHATYTFYQPPADVKAYVKMLFTAANP